MAKETRQWVKWSHRQVFCHQSWEIRRSQLPRRSQPSSRWRSSKLCSSKQPKATLDCVGTDRKGRKELKTELQQRVYCQFKWKKMRQKGSNFRGQNPRPVLVPYEHGTKVCCYVQKNKKILLLFTQCTPYLEKTPGLLCYQQVNMLQSTDNS